MEVTQVLDLPASQSFYSVAGRLLFVESSDLRLARLIERLFEGWLLSPVVSPSRDPDLKITLFCGERPPEIPSGSDQFEIAEGGQCYIEGDGYYLQFSNSLLHLQPGAPVKVSLWIQDLPHSPDAALARATSFAICAGLRRCGLFDLHGAGVVDPQGEKGVLIVGPSGSGKSTLTLQLAIARWQYLSDDELLLNLVDDEVEARGFRRYFAISETTAVTLGIENTGDSATDGRPHVALKVCFEPGCFFPATLATRIQPGLLLFTAISENKETRLSELTQPETMVRLIKACPWATYDTPIAGSFLELLSRLARQTRSFDLMAGSDLLEPGRASNLLTPLCKA